MWEGPAHELLERLSMFFGFSFREVGARPEEPLVVELWARGQPMISVLRWVGFCARGKGGWVVVDEARHEVELVHPERQEGARWGS